LEAGQSGNPNGKPPGTRQAFSQGFIKDFALVWQEDGLAAVRKLACAFRSITSHANLRTWWKL
jgi:hypothetical protein